MMKKVYVKPSMESATFSMENLLHATSIENEKGDVQPGIKEDGSEDFEAGAKENNKPWSVWDE